jgi:single-strand DNA-binding protein
MYHNIIIAGHLGRDPEMKYTPTGQTVTSLSVAVSDDYNSKEGERVKRTIWFRVNAWGKLAETCNEYLAKGRKVLVEGRLVADQNGNPRTFQRQDGSTGASFEITAKTVRFLSDRQQDGSQEQVAAIDEEIPF